MKKLIQKILKEDLDGWAWAEGSHSLLGLDENKEYKVWFDYFLEDSEKIDVFDRLRFLGFDIPHTWMEYSVCSLYFRYTNEGVDSEWDVSYMGSGTLKYCRDYYLSEGNSDIIELPKEMFFED